MDEIVRKAMARWPDVPAVYGWLRLDRRGRWLIKGEPISNPVVNEFINRNYAHDGQGRWYFQNGPQQVFVELDCAPYILRVWRIADGLLRGETHTGLAMSEPRRAWLDDAGGVLIEWEQGVGHVESQSLETIAGALRKADGAPLDAADLSALATADSAFAQGPHLDWNGTLLPVAGITRSQAPARFGFDPAPVPPPGSDPC
jgi:hypothetical protein